MNFSILFLKYKIFVFVVLGILVFVLSFQFVFPQWNQILATRQNLSVKKAHLTLLLAKTGELESLNEYELSQRAKIALSAIPAEKNPVQVLGMISRLAQEEGLVLSKLSVSPGELFTGVSQAQDTKRSLSFKVEVSGPYSSVKEFLKTLNKTLPLIASTKVRIALAAEMATLEFEVESFFLPLPKELGKPDSPLPTLTSEQEEVLVRLSTFSPGIISSSPETMPPTTGKPNPFSF